MVLAFMPLKAICSYSNIQSRANYVLNTLCLLLLGDKSMEMILS